MSGQKDRRFYDVAIEPSAAALFQASSQSTRTKSSERAEFHDSASALPNYFALNFNFKPDSTHDCKRGALFQPGPSRNPPADWQLELDDDKPATASDNTAGSTKKSAHVFTGPQTAAKSYDVVLIWDEAAQTYRLDRVAATFSLKYERSKTILSNQSQEVWEKDAKKPRKRPASDSSAPHPIANTQYSDRREQLQDSATSLRREPASLAHPIHAISKASQSSGSKSNEGLKLRSRKAVVAAPLRRSSRGALPVEMEEFDDQPVAFSTAASSSQAPRPEPQERNNAKEPRTSTQELESSSFTESAGGLRRSRRHSTQIQAEESIAPAPRRSEGSSSDMNASVNANADENTEGEDDDLALELERELERELDIEMEDGSEDEATAPAPRGRPAAPTTSRTLSPISRLKLSDRQSKISTPKAHTPEVEDNSSRLRLTPSEDAPTHARTTASIGLGLQQTGVGITPTASPHLDIASPKTAVMEVETSEGEQHAEASTKFDDAKFEGAPDDDDDDDLDDFAAELDMSLAEVPDPAPVIEKRRSSRGLNSVHSTSDLNSSSRSQRQVRKAYGLGGPRQEEEELEDSD